jgi:hypothetical protein
MGDRIDESWMREQQKEMKEERSRQVQEAGPLFDDRTRAQFEYKIADATRLPKDEVKDIVDTIDRLAGEYKANPREVIKEAVSGHIKKEAFVNNLAKELEGGVKAAMEAREERIEAGDSKPAVAANKLSVKPPTQKM